MQQNDKNNSVQQLGSAVWRSEPPDIAGYWLAWTTAEWTGKVFGYMHCVLVQYDDSRGFFWCVPWELNKWEGVLWHGPVETPNDPSSATAAKVDVERNETVELLSDSERKEERLFAVAPLLDCNFQDLESFIYSNWKCSNPPSS